MGESGDGAVLRGPDGRRRVACPGSTSSIRTTLELATLSICGVQEKEVGTALELRVRTPQGWRLVEVIGKTLPMGRDTRILLSLRDLTERRRLDATSRLAAESELRDTLSLARSHARRDGRRCPCRSIARTTS